MEITHALAPHFAALRAVRNRRALVRSDLWARIGAEVERVCAAIELAQHPAARPRPLAGLKVVAWNIQRGAHFDAVREVLAALDADVVLLAEVDSGMGRSGDRNVARELAAALGMGYAFAVSYLALEDDLGENPDRRPNSLALAGGAILSRLPIRRASNVDLPELRDKFSSSERRLGHKRAVMVEVELEGGGALPLGGCHLDSGASPAGRARQLAALLDALPAGPALVGGDFNTSTYDQSSIPALARDLLHKRFVTGFDATIANYMTPERRYETPVFEALAARGFATEGWNDRAAGTMRYDVNDPYAVAKFRQALGGVLTRWLQRRLRPWNGVVPARLDWFAGRDLVPGAAAVADPRGGSDHSPIVVELTRPPG